MPLKDCNIFILSDGIKAKICRVKVSNYRKANSKA